LRATSWPKEPLRAPKRVQSPAQPRRPRWPARQRESGYLGSSSSWSCSSGLLVECLLGGAAAADLVVDQHALRSPDTELGAGLSVFHGDLDAALVGVSGGGDREQGSDQQAGEGLGLGCHGPGPSVVRFLLV